MKLFKNTLTKIDELGFKLVEEKKVNNHKVEIYEDMTIHTNICK